MQLPGSGRGFQDESKGELTYLWEGPIFRGRKEDGRMAGSWDVHSPTHMKPPHTLGMTELIHVFLQAGR